MKKIITLLILMVLLIPSIFAKDGLSVGGSLDVDMGSNKDTIASGSLNVEYKPIDVFSLGFKLTGKTDFSESLTATPAIFARLYPFGGAFLEGSMGGNILWKGNVINLNNLVAGAALGWRITSGKSYIEPKVNLEYIFGAPEPYSWSAGVGAGYTF